MKGKDELEGTRSNFTPWLPDFEHQGENCLGVVATPPLGELGLITIQIYTFWRNFFLLYSKIYTHWNIYYNSILEVQSLSNAIEQKINFLY